MSLTTHASTGPAVVIADTTASANRSQQYYVVPWPLPDDVKQRLVLRTRPIGAQPRRHRLDALALARQQMPCAVDRNGPTRSACPNARDSLST